MQLLDLCMFGVCLVYSAVEEKKNASIFLR